MPVRGFMMASFVGFFAVVPSISQAQTLTCRLDPGSHGAYIAREIRIEMRGAYEASVTDSVIASTGRRSVAATVDSSKPDRMRIVWEVPDVEKSPLESRPGPIKLSMRLSVEKAGGAARLEAQDLLNRKYSYKARGRCTIAG